MKRDYSNRQRIWLEAEITRLLGSMDEIEVHLTTALVIARDRLTTAGRPSGHWKHELRKHIMYAIDEAKRARLPF